MRAELVRDRPRSAVGSTLGPPPEPLDPDSFRAAFRGHAAGVAIVTADTGRGPVGLTVTSVVSLSLCPPLASFAVSGWSSTITTFDSAARVAIHFLDRGQVELARRFAAVGADRFAADLRWSRLDCGTPVLADPPAYIAGSIVHRLTTGDHRLVIAMPDHHRHRRAYVPLVHHDGRYGRVQPSA